MKAVIQRVAGASVDVGGKTVGSIDAGLVILLGIAVGDTAAQAEKLAAKIALLRIFEDAGGKLNLSLTDTGGSALVVSNFTVCGDCSHGHRPNFSGAEKYELAEPVYRAFIHGLESCGVPCETGLFGADMRLSLVNDGPVTVIIES